jgi:hypothetical protein
MPRADGADVAGWLVQHGVALDWPQYSKGAYAALQAKAQTARAGIWQGHFQEPWGSFGMIGEPARSGLIELGLPSWRPLR